MTRPHNRDVVLLASLGTQPSSLVRLLDSHPEIAAPPAMRLTSLLHTASRNAVRAIRGGIDGSATTLTDTVAFARETCTAALKAVFDDVRSHTRSRAIVLSDPDRLTYPFADASGIDVILLRPGPRHLGFGHIDGVYERRVASLVRQDVEGLFSRARVWGVEEDRIFSIDEDDAYSESGFQGLLGFLGADTATASAMLSRQLAGRAAAAAD